MVACRLFSNMSDNIFSISDILNKDLFGSNKSAAIKYSTIFSFWGQIAGRKFLNSSKPVQIKGNKVFVTCENPYVLQELLMYKKVLLSKLKPYCEPLGVKIEDIVFDYKNWQNYTQSAVPDDFPDFYDDEKLSGVAIEYSEFEQAFLNIDKSPYLNEEQKVKFKNRIIKLQKAKKLRIS